MLRYALFTILLIASSSCHRTQKIDVNDQVAIESHLQSLLEECINDSFESVPGVSMSIKSPLLQEHWDGVAGHADKEYHRRLRPDQPFRIASVTKTFVAAAILRLHEMDSLSIDQPISEYIDDETISILKSGDYEPDHILIRHCLNHTSGLFDYAIGSDYYINKIISDPNKVWTRKEQLQVAISWGNRIGDPGGQTEYSDSGYVILGAIIESFYQGDLALGLRDLLSLTELGLSLTWLEDLEEGYMSKDSMVHRYHGKYETTDWDASVDLYGGGGLVSTTHDLSEFIYALFNDEIYNHSSTIDLMQSKPKYVIESKNSQTEMYYNYGYWTIEVYGHKAHMHTGFWGTAMLYIPSLESSIAINTTKGKSDRLIKKTISLLHQIKENQ